MRLAVIGRPNVGKSSLVNKLLGAERVIVSDVAGTTRDAIDLPLEVDGRQVILVDTAGLRRQAKVSQDVEYYTALRSQRAAERADVAIVVCDATDGVTSQDLRVAELAMGANCATVLVLNKWDVTEMDEDDLNHERAKVNQKLRLRPEGADREREDRPRPRAPAARGARARRPRDATASRRPSSTAGCRRSLQARQPPMKQGHRLKLIYAAQIGERPPRFAIQVNNRARVTRDYAYFLENRLRARFGLDGVPVIIDFNERKQRRSER